MLPNLLNLTLLDMGLPSDPVAFAQCFPVVSTLEFFPLDASFTPEATAFLLAIAPRLGTLRLQNRLLGIPISLVQRLIQAGSSMHTLACSMLMDDAPSQVTANNAEPGLRPSASVQPLHLELALAGVRHRYTWSVTKREDIMLESVLQWTEVPLARIRAVRRVSRVTLESWWVDDLGYGREVAVEQFREQGLQLDFESFGLFMQ